MGYVSISLGLEPIIVAHLELSRCFPTAVHTTLWS